MSNKILFLIFLIIPFLAFSQNKEDREILHSLQENISRLSLLSNDSNSISSGDHFMEQQFQAAGLRPVSNNHSYLQPIITDHGKQFIPGTSLSINSKTLSPGKDFIPLPYSAQATANGDPLIAVQEANLPWIVDISNYSGTQLTGTDTNENETMYRLAAQAVHDKATAVIFYNSNNSAEDITFHAAENKAPLTIPVVYINHAPSSQYFKDQTADAKIKLQVGFYEKMDTAYNVMGSIHNGAASTVIISAYQPGDKAALISLSKLLKNNKRCAKLNYLFVAFTEKKGPEYFMKHPVINLEQADCMISLNSTGKLNASSGNLMVKGTQTSPQWEPILHRVKSREINLQTADNISNSPGGNIPAITFSTNTSGNISAESELKVVNYLAELIKELNRMGKLQASTH